MTIASVPGAIATALGTISGLRVSAYGLDQVNPPQAQVLFRGIPSYDTVQQTGSYDGVFVVRVYVGRTAEVAAQKFLYTLVDPTGVHDAIDADPTLGGVVSDCHVRAVSETEAVLVNDIEYLAVDFELDVVV